MTPSSKSLRRPLRALGALALILAALAAGSSGAAAYVTPAAAEHAAARGASWFQTSQQESGELTSDWAMTALAAVGVNAADVRVSSLAPSAQDFYLDEWQASGPGGAGTDAARGILAGVAGGIQTTRLSTAADATKSNLVARLAELFDGEQIGSTGLLNDDIFGVLALHQAGAPQPLLQELVAYLRTKQLADGGWSWSSSPGASSDIDMTGSAIAAFCAAGIGAGDPDVQRALALLHASQDPATGGFAAPPPFGVGVNTDTTAWVVSGLVQCGIDPQGLEWTTPQGKTPLDYLISMQRPDGHFDWTEEFGGGAFETFSAVRPLAGVAFSTAAPERADGVSASVRPAEHVPAGTTVPITLVIDHGPGAEDIRMCRVDVASGSGLGAVLATAQAGSTPAGCVTEFALDGGLSSLDGVTATAEYNWRVQVDGAAATASEPIGFGDLVFLRYAATIADPGPAPQVVVPPVVAEKPRLSRGARVKVRGRAHWRDNAIAVALRCPRGLGEFGCRGLLTVGLSADGKVRELGSAAYAIPSGARRVVTVTPGAAVRERLAAGGRLRFTAATRDEDGAVRLTRAKRMLAG